MSAGRHPLCDGDLRKTGGELKAPRDIAQRHVAEKGTVSFITVCGHPLEIERITGRGAGGPTLVFLHEGLGSVSLWRDFPTRLAEVTGCPALVYSRSGYGLSIPNEEPRPIDWLHKEALETLPALRAALGLEDVILIGHSDGASIALIHAGSESYPVRGLVIEAPHVFVEEVTMVGLRDAVSAYETGGLRDRLARYHANVDVTFRGWSDFWGRPESRHWNIEQYLSGVRCPVLAIQGALDEFGTLAQLDAIERQISGPFERLVLARCGHSPHREQKQITLGTMTAFIARSHRSD